jgi:hypothetical protein
LIDGRPRDYRKTYLLIDGRPRDYRKTYKMNIVNQVQQ